MAVHPVSTNSTTQSAGRGAGHPSNDDVEARTPAGRAAHWLEARCLDLVSRFSRFYHAHDRETLFDRVCDDLRERAIRMMTCPCSLEARVLLIQSREPDALRDAEHRNQRQHVTAAHNVVRRIGAAVERSCAALRRAPRSTGEGR